MSERKVKGSILLDYVRMIRANKDKDWGKYLTQEDWEIINGRVLPSLWYPFETFQRAGLASFEILGGGNMDMVRAWGRISLEQLVKGIYKSLVADRDPAKALDRFVLMRRQFFNFAAMEVKPIDEKHVKVLIEFSLSDPGSEPYCAQLQGVFERLIELTGGADPKATFGGSKIDGKDIIEFDVAWK